jgi:hypothetical protein
MMSGNMDLILQVKKKSELLFLNQIQIMYMLVNFEMMLQIHDALVVLKIVDFMQDGMIISYLFLTMMLISVNQDFMKIFKESKRKSNLEKRLEEMQIEFYEVNEQELQQKIPILQIVQLLVIMMTAMILLNLLNRKNLV